MHIFKLLSEEVFDFNRGELTQAKTRMLKTQLNVEFGRIHELCHFVLSSVDLWSTRPNLIKATLAALQVRMWADVAKLPSPSPAKRCLCAAVQLWPLSYHVPRDQVQ